MKGGGEEGRKDLTSGGPEEKGRVTVTYGPVPTLSNRFRKDEVTTSHPVVVTVVDPRTLFTSVRSGWGLDDVVFAENLFRVP